VARQRFPQIGHKGPPMGNRHLLVATAVQAVRLASCNFQIATVVCQRQADCKRSRGRPSSCRVVAIQEEVAEVALIHWPRCSATYHKSSWLLC
jgi:hypothetical protein